MSTQCARAARDGHTATRQVVGETWYDVRDLVEKYVKAIAGCGIHYEMSHTSHVTSHRSQVTRHLHKEPEICKGGSEELQHIIGHAALQRQRRR
jgi:hypothetical protein